MSRTADASENADSAYDDAYDAWIAGGEVGPEPEKPAGYDDWTSGTNAQFTEPAGDDTDPLPAIYRRIRTQDEYDGVEGGYVHTYTGPYPGGEGTDPGDDCTWQTLTWTPGQDPVVATKYGSGNWWDDGAGDAGSTGVVVDADPPLTAPLFTHTGSWVAQNNACSRTATTLSPANSVRVMDYGTPIAAPTGTPEDWPQSGGDWVTWAVDFTETWDMTTISDPITLTELVANAAAKIPETWPETPEGTVCTASSDDTWPTIGSFKTGSPAAWPGCEDVPLSASATATVVAVRYRFGVPENYSTAEAPRSTWEMQWDEVSASDDWWAWFDGGMTGTEPTPGPSLVTARSWVWGGSMESQWSSWFEMDPPTGPDSQVRVVNVLIKCWKSTRIGVAPTAYGDQVELPA